MAGEQPLETTDIERAFWAFDRACVSNIVVVARIDGRVSPEVLFQAARAVARRHPYLRHTFSEDGLELLPHAEALVEVRDDPPSDPRGWKFAVEEELHARFILSHLPLVRLRVWGEERETFLAVTLPHVFSDAFSAFRFVGEILAAADTLFEGRPIESAPPFPFVRPRSTVFPPSKSPPAGWTDGGLVPGMMLSTTSRQFSLLSVSDELLPFATRSGVVPFVISETATAHLSKCCADQGFTLNSGLTGGAMTVFADWLRRTGRQPDFRVSTAVNLRDRSLNPYPEDPAMGVWAGRFSLWAHLDGKIPSQSVALVFQDAVTTLRQTAYRALVGIESGSDLPAPQLKLTNHGNLDSRGLSYFYRFGKIRSLRAFTTMHRGIRGNLGFGLIPSVFQGRLNLSFIVPLPSVGGPAVDWGSSLAESLGLSPADLTEE